MQFISTISFMHQALEMRLLHNFVHINIYSNKLCKDHTEQPRSTAYFPAKNDSECDEGAPRAKARSRLAKRAGRSLTLEWLIGDRRSQSRLPLASCSLDHFAGFELRCSWCFLASSFWLLSMDTTLLVLLLSYPAQITIKIHGFCLLPWRQLGGPPDDVFGHAKDSLTMGNYPRAPMSYFPVDGFEPRQGGSVFSRLSDPYLTFETVPPGPKLRLMLCALCLFRQSSSSQGLVNPGFSYVGLVAKQSLRSKIKVFTSTPLKRWKLAGGK